MSNPSIVTKLLTLVKGAFGSKDAAPAPAAAPAAKESRGEGEGNSAPEQGNAAPAEAAEKSESAGTAEKAEPSEPAEKNQAESVTETSSDAPAGTEPAAAEEPVSEKPAAEAPAAEETGQAADSGPATDDVPEKDAAIAKELSTNEAHTEVASDDVLERVRKGAAPGAEDLAVPTYDELSLPSIRARLRKLTIDQVRDLRAYEVAHESRPEFIKMYDNRIAKLQAED